MELTVENNRDIFQEEAAFADLITRDDLATARYCHQWGKHPISQVSH